MDATEEPFEAALYVVRARRLADLSQRDLASRAGLSSSAVDRIEQGGDVRVRTLTRILALAGLRLAVLDVEGQTVEPFPDDSVRDNGERRFPAHLDVQPPDVLPAEAIDSPRYDRPPPRGWYHHRPVRDLHRAERPPHRDHPTVGELAVRAHLLLLRRIPRERERRLRHPGTAPRVAGAPGPPGHDLAARRAGASDWLPGLPLAPELPVRAETSRRGPMSAQLSRRTVLGAAGALGAVALVPRAATPAVAGGHGGGVSATVNVTTYNIFSAAFDERFPNNTWASRRIAVGDIIRQRNHDPDVLAVQEGQVAQQVDELHQTLGGPYQHYTATADISPRSIVWKRSRFHAVEAGEFVVLGPEVEGHEVQRLGTQVRLRELRTRRELLVLNIHVPTGSSEELQRIRHDAATRIAAHAKAQSEEHGGIPVIVAGDFNNYYATVIGGIPSAPRTMTDLGLTETYAASPVESRLNPDIKSKNDIVNAMAGVGPDGSQRLDYIFTYPAARAEVLDWRMIVNFAPGTELGLRTPVPSDHHPTRSRLRLTWPG